MMQMTAIDISLYVERSNFIYLDLLFLIRVMFVLVLVRVDIGTVYLCSVCMFCDHLPIPGPVHIQFPAPNKCFFFFLNLLSFCTRPTNI